MNQKLISSILVGIMILLGIPTTAIIASNNALPGDAMYPVKTTLEKFAGKLISPSYQAKSELEIKLIERRIEENQQLLLSSGSTEGLALLVAQAESAKEYILNSNISYESRSKAAKHLIQVLQNSNNQLEQQRQAYTKPNHTTIIYKTVYVTNPTVSQGNSPKQNDDKDESQTDQQDSNQDTAKKIEDTQKDLENIINQIEEESQDSNELDSGTDSTIPALDEQNESFSGDNQTNGYFGKSSNIDRGSASPEPSPTTETTTAPVIADPVVEDPIETTSTPDTQSQDSGQD